MKKNILLIAFVIIATFSAKAQVEISSPHRDLDIKFVECVYSAGAVYFDLLITNIGKDAKAGIDNVKTTAFDDLGNGYSYKTGTMKSGLANEVLNSGSMSRTVNYAFPKDIPMRFRFKIENVSSDATKFTFLSIVFSSLDFERLNNHTKLLEIRNMEWEK